MFTEKWQRVGQFALRSIKSIILCGIKSNCLSSGSSQSFYLFIRMVIKQTVVITDVYHIFNCIKKILSSIMLSKLTPYAEENIGDHQCGFRRNRSPTDHIFCICQIIEEKWDLNQAVHSIFINFKKAYYSVRREILYNILIDQVSPLNW